MIMLRACESAFNELAFIFTSDVDGRAPWRPDVVTNRFGRLCKSTGISEVRLHDLRRYIATNLGTAGAPIATISARLGHRDKATTLNVYQHHAPDSRPASCGVARRLVGPGRGLRRGRPDLRVMSPIWAVHSLPEDPLPSVYIRVELALYRCRPLDQDLSRDALNQHPWDIHGADPDVPGCPA